MQGVPIEHIPVSLRWLVPGVDEECAMGCAVDTLRAKCAGTSSPHFWQLKLSVIKANQAT